MAKPWIPSGRRGLRKVAIVSLRDRQAQEVAELLRNRFDAKIVVASEINPGTNTRSAHSADVVLFVWSATTHAVFRSFDNMDKNRVANVQGTGAASIVLAYRSGSGDNMEFMERGSEREGQPPEVDRVVAGRHSIVGAW
jgi:hypothetical protein